MLVEVSEGRIPGVNTFIPIIGYVIIYVLSAKSLKAPHGKKRIVLYLCSS